MDNSETGITDVWKGGSMRARDAVISRKSIRSFEPNEVPRALLETILRDALRAPSWGNTQPWGVNIVSGGPLDRIKQACLVAFREERPIHPEVERPVIWAEAETRRYKALGRQLYETLGIGREDQQKRKAYEEQVILSFGAPHLIYLHLKSGFNVYAMMDAGCLLQTIALLATEEGLGTCFLARSILFPDIVRRHARIPDGRTLVMGMAIGYPQKEHPLATFQSQRGTQDEFILWVDE
jgi:nitroreductase